MKKVSARKKATIKRKASTKKKASAGTLIDAFTAFEATGDEGHDVERLCELCGQWEKLPRAERTKVVPAMLGVFERNPDCCELGLPGPLVHAVESVPSYRTALVDSIGRTPAWYTIWMVNRILNLGKKKDWESWMGLLENVAKSRKVSSDLRGQAKEFWSYQKIG